MHTCLGMVEVMNNEIKPRTDYLGIDWSCTYKNFQYSNNSPVWIGHEYFTEKNNNRYICFLNLLFDIKKFLRNSDIWSEICFIPTKVGTSDFICWIHDTLECCCLAFLEILIFPYKVCRANSKLQENLKNEKMNGIAGGSGHSIFPLTNWKSLKWMCVATLTERKRKKNTIHVYRRVNNSQEGEPRISIIAVRFQLHNCRREIIEKFLKDSGNLGS